MKLASLFILFLAFSQISVNLCGTISRSHRYKRTRMTKGNPPAQNNWYQFLLGIVFGLAGQAQDINSLDKCVPEDWRAVNTTPPKIDGAPKDKSTFDKVLGAIKKIVDLVCKFKSKFLQLVGGKVRKVLRRRKYRMFTETGVTTRGIFSRFIDKIDEKVTSGLDKIKDWKNQTWDNIKALAGGVVQQIKGIIEQFTETIKQFFGQDTYNKLKKFFECAQGIAKVAMGLVSIVTGIMKKITLISSIAGHNYLAIAQLIIDLICNYPLFIEAFKYLMQSIEESQALKKYALVGKFLGTGFRALVI